MNTKPYELIIGKNADREKQNMIWNMTGSLCYALASVILSVAVMRIAGDVRGGIFAFAFSTFGQQMFNIAYFGIRPYQVTDEHDFSFGDYLRHRLGTCLIAVLIAVLYLGMSGYSKEKTTIIFLMVLYKVIDGLADVYESEFQRRGYLYITGKSNTYRTLLSVTCFLTVLLVSDNLLLSCISAVTAQAAGFVSFDMYMINHIDGVDKKVNSKSTVKIYTQTSLLFFSVFLDFYILSAAKYAIDARINDAASGYFNIIFMPTQVINLVAGFVIRPYLTGLTEKWNGNDYSGFSSMLKRIAGVIIGLMFLSTAGTALLGKFVLRLAEIILGPVYTGKLIIYNLPFVFIILGGGFYALANLMYYALVIMRKQNIIFIIYTVTAVAALCTAPVFVSLSGMTGAAFIYMILMLCLVAGFGGVTFALYRKESRV